ncbi:MAG: hypothetical protein ABIO05_02585, partial [Ferruginibacter sp.]
MVPQLRKAFNDKFTEEKYAAYMQQVENLEPGALDFRNAETPIFVNKAFKNKMLAACEDIIDVFIDPNFRALTQRSIPPSFAIPGDEGKPECIVFDFGVCENSSGELEPQLIEMQGFPSLFGFQAYHSALTAAYADVPENYSPYLNGYTQQSYIQLLKDIIVGEYAKENVILLEIYPEKQKTRIDFYCTEKMLGIKTVCLTNLISKDNKLYYLNDGKKIQIKRIYNRLIFDDLNQQEGLEN